MTEKRFTLAYEKDNWWAVKDYDITLWKEDVIFLMNKLYEENIQLRKDNEELHLQLNLTADQRNEFHRGARENANRVGKLEKENEQLKKDHHILNAFIIEKIGYNQYLKWRKKNIEDPYKEPYLTWEIDKND